MCSVSHMGGTMSTTSTNAASSWAHAWADTIGGAVQRADWPGFRALQTAFSTVGHVIQVFDTFAHLGATMSVHTEPVHFVIEQILEPCLRSAC